jgi:hypothetical protein
MGEVRVERFMEKRRYHFCEGNRESRSLPAENNNYKGNREIDDLESLSSCLCVMDDNHHNRMDCLPLISS